jgi:hypothetical protein
MAILAPPLVRVSDEQQTYTRTAGVVRQLDRTVKGATSRFDVKGPKSRLDLELRSD